MLCHIPKCLPFPQVWESVPFLVSYQSSVIKEGATIPSYPDMLIRTWNGNRQLFCPKYISPCVG